MNNGPLRWLGRYLGTFALALVLALLVWFTAVLNTDPNVECQDFTTVNLEIVGQDVNMQLVGEIPSAVEVKLQTPASICEKISNEPGAVRAFIDLSSLPEGDHSVVVNVSLADYRPLRLLEVFPEEITFTLESLMTRTLPIIVKVVGEPALGFTKGSTIVDASRVDISGLRSLVNQVAEARIMVNISNAQEEIDRSYPIQLLDGEDNPVLGVSLLPENVNVRQIVERPGNFRDVTVKLITTGQLAEGYQLTNISVSPQFVTLFSADQQLLLNLPGFVETVPLDITDATDDIERRLSLVLPEGVSVFGDEQTVVVQVGIAAIQRSKPFFALPFEVIGLSQGLTVELSIDIVDVILAGPGPILEFMQPEDVRVVVDLTGLEPGEYSIEPQVVISPIGVEPESVLPTTIEVIILVAPTETPTPGAGVIGEPTPTNTFLPTFTPTPQ